MTNALAYYKIGKLRTKKFYNIDTMSNESIPILKSESFKKLLLKINCLA